MIFHRVMIIGMSLESSTPQTILPRILQKVNNHGPSQVAALLEQTIDHR